MNKYNSSTNLPTNIKGIWRSILESISGTDQDFTEGRLGKALLLLSIPMVLEMVMESVFAIVDIYFVSKLGPDAVATVGITESLMTLIYAIAMGLSMATTAMVSRRIGEKDKKGAGTAAFQAILTGAFVSLMIAIPGIIWAPRLLTLMGASAEMASAYSGYPAIMLGTNIVIMMLFLINAVFRSSGDAAISMRVLWMANILNVILDPCLIFGWGPFPELGIAGAAVATSIGRGIAVLYQFWLLFYGKKRVSLSRQNIRIDFGVINKLIRLSLGGIGQFMIATSSWIGLVRIISMFGSEVLAGYTIAIRLIMFSLLPSWGISNAAATLVGQNLGAKKPDRAERSAWKTGTINLLLLGFIGIIFIMFPDPFIRIFIDDPEVIQTGASCLRIISYGFLAYGFGMVMVNSFNGAGDTATPTKINFFCFWLLEIPLAYVLAMPFKMQQEGVFYAILIAETVMTISAIWLFKRGKWKLKEV